MSRAQLNRRVSIARLLQVTLATMLVAGVPVVVVWWLRASRLSTPLVSLLAGMGLSLLISYGGRLLWEKRPGSEDLLFSELMIWGYVNRWRVQRRLSSALDLVGPISDSRHVADGIGVKKRAKLLESLVASIETRDPYLHGHSRRVARHSWMIAKRMGLARAEVARIRTAAAIHDVGKVKTPTSILHKPASLTDEEYEVIKRHPEEGAAMASVLKDEELVAMVLYHHERIDGSGYPAGLLGAEIPLGARIIAVADTFDAITSARPYRAAGAHKKAMMILREESGTRLDADVVKAFCDHYAGRGPLALWSLLAGLPERILSWLGGSVASVASAVKVAAVSAVVAGAAVTSSTFGLPAGGHQRVASGRRSASTGVTAGARAPGWGARLGVVPAGTIHRPSTRHRRTGVRHETRPAVAAPRTAGSPITTTGAATQGGGNPQPKGPALESSEAGGETTVKNPGLSQEAPAKGKSEEAPSKPRSEEAPGKSKKAPSSGKEAPAKGKAEETPPAKSEEKAREHETETPQKGKSEEGPAGGAGQQISGKGSGSGSAEAEPGSSVGKKESHAEKGK